MKELKQNFRNLIQNTLPLVKKIEADSSSSDTGEITLTGDEARRIVQFFAECVYVCSGMGE